MTARRDFLRGLVSLPLIGGGVTLIGQPTAVAEPVTDNLMEAYKTWLMGEHRIIAHELARSPKYTSYYRGRSHREIFEATQRMAVFVGRGQPDQFDKDNPASARAALVLSTVGCDWRGDDL